MRIVNGVAIERFNMYMNPECELSAWSAANLKKMDGTVVTNAWLATQLSMKHVHELFSKWAGPNPLLGGQVL